MRALYSALCKRYDADTIGELLMVCREFWEAAIGGVLLFVGIVSVWFIGCMM